MSEELEAVRRKLRTLRELHAPYLPAGKSLVLFGCCAGLSQMIDTPTSARVEYIPVSCGVPGHSGEFNTIIHGTGPLKVTEVSA